MIVLKKNEIGSALKVIGFIVMILGAICSFISAFKSQSMVDDFMGMMMLPPVNSSMTVDYVSIITGIVLSVAAGAILIGISEIIFILDEHRENSRRMCHRFGIEPAEYDKYADAKKAMKTMAKQSQGQPQHQFNEEAMSQDSQQPSNNIHEDYGDE